MGNSRAKNTAHLDALRFDAPRFEGNRHERRRRLSEFKRELKRILKEREA